jgi:hypothetical protein
LSINLSCNRPVRYIEQHVDKIKNGDDKNYIKNHKTEIEDSIIKAKKQISELTQIIESMKTEIASIFKTC